MVFISRIMLFFSTYSVWTLVFLTLVCNSGEKWVTTERKMFFQHIHRDRWALHGGPEAVWACRTFWLLVCTWWASQLDSPLGFNKLITVRQLRRVAALASYENESVFALKIGCKQCNSKHSHGNGIFKDFMRWDIYLKCRAGHGIKQALPLDRIKFYPEKTTQQLFK